MLDQSSFLEFCSSTDAAYDDHGIKVHQTTYSIKGNMQNNSLVAWHLQLGHPSKVVMEYLHIPYDLNKGSSSFICEIYPTSKINLQPATFLP